MVDAAATNAPGTGGASIFRQVCDAFGLGSPVSLRERPANSTNATWDLETADGRFLVKQFRYPPDDEIWLRAIEEASEFEWQAHSHAIVPMPIPVRSVSGRMVEVVDGAQGGSALTRVHQWSSGVQADLAPQTTLVDAGAQLATVQEFGGSYRTASEGSLWWWSWDPRCWVDALRVEGYLDRSEASRASSVLEEAERCIFLAERQATRWTMCHFDHKPANVLVHDGALTLVDWDEAAMCPPGMEAAEAAILWASTTEGIDRRRLVAFLEGYRSVGGALDTVSVDDLGKWLASKVGWFDYVARRALGVLPASRHEAIESVAAARATLEKLSVGVGHLGRWVRWMS